VNGYVEATMHNAVRERALAGAPTGYKSNATARPDDLRAVR
jgi:hypothetical protein